MSWNEADVNELAPEIDTYDLARTLLDGLECHGAEPTVENGKKLWQNILETELPEAIRLSVKYSPLFA